MRLYKSLYNLLRKLLRLVSRFKTYVRIRASKLRQWIAMILFCECLFYMRHKYLEYHVNHYLPFDVITLPCNKNKVETLKKYAMQYNGYFDGSHESHRQWLEKRFNCSLQQIKKGNARHFVQWAYFIQYDDKTKATLTDKEIEWRENFISDYIKDTEATIDHTFEEGYNDSIQTVFCTHPKQKIKIIFHPLTMYLAIYTAKQLANGIFMGYLGFKYRYINGLKVWYRLNSVDHINTTNCIHREPILMFGGISAANPMQCTVLMHSFIQKYKGTKNLFIIEIPWSEMSIAHFIPYCGYLNHKIPLKTDELVDIVLALEHMILRHNACDVTEDERLQLQWNLAGQSFGTFMSAMIYHRIKERELGVIPRLILLDAAVLIMTDPKQNRLQGMVEKTDLVKRMFQLIIGQEIMVATWAARYFQWMEYCVFPHQLINDGCNKPHIIVSGTCDHIIPFATIKKGVQEANKLCNRDQHKIIHMIMDGARHGVIMVHKGYHAQLVELL